MKALLSIPGSSATRVLKSLHRNAIPCTYVGLDQSGRIIMEITYKSNQTHVITEINDFIETCESLLVELTNEVNKAIEAHNSPFYKLIDEMKKTREEREKKEPLVIE